MRVSSAAITETPKLAVTPIAPPSIARGSAATTARRRSATATAAAASPGPSTARNSSPPQRATMSSGRMAPRSRAATPASTRSPLS